MRFVSPRRFPAERLTVEVRLCVSSRSKDDDGSTDGNDDGGRAGVDNEIIDNASGASHDGGQIVCRVFVILCYQWRQYCRWSYRRHWRHCRQ